MNGSCFRLRIVTPSRVLEREISHLRLKDPSGFFGVMHNHADFITVLLPSLGYYTDSEGKEIFLAVDEGILCMKRGAATLSTREVFESRDAEELSDMIGMTILKRAESEAAFCELLRGMERAFIEKTLEFEKGG